MACSLLISKRLIKYIDIAEKLLSKFVKDARPLYGDEFIIYNVHNLLHISSDARLYGTLDEFSAFPFESYIGYLKNMIKSHKLPLQQLSNRIQEEQRFTSNEGESGKIPGV